MSNTESDIPKRLDWAVLLAKWTEFARAAVALPREGVGAQWRRSITPIITLQAVTLALGELEQIAESERAVALDRAELLINRSAHELEEIWGADSPEEVGRLIDDAGRALADAGARYGSGENRSAG